MSEAVVTVVEGNQPVLQFSAKERQPSGAKVAMDLTGATITLFVKDNRDATDASADTSVGTILGDPLLGNFQVPVVAAMSDVPGLYFYKVNVVKAGKPVTVQYGDWIVENA